MGICDTEIWKCRSCGFTFEAEDGLYEADPCDFGTTHSVSPYTCPLCGNVKNVSSCCSIDAPKPENEDLCSNDSDICERCNIKMVPLDKGKFYRIPFLSKKYKCPKCYRKSFKFLKSDGSWMT